jgi:hypothetical protein
MLPTAVVGVATGVELTVVAAGGTAAAGANAAWWTTTAVASGFLLLMGAQGGGKLWECYQLIQQARARAEVARTSEDERLVNDLNSTALLRGLEGGLDLLWASVGAFKLRAVFNRPAGATSPSSEPPSRAAERTPGPPPQAEPAPEPTPPSERPPAEPPPQPPQQPTPRRSSIAPPRGDGSDFEPPLPPAEEEEPLPPDTFRRTRSYEPVRTVGQMLKQLRDYALRRLNEAIFGDSSLSVDSDYLRYMDAYIERTGLPLEEDVEVYGGEFEKSRLWIHRAGNPGEWTEDPGFGEWTPRTADTPRMYNNPKLVIPKGTRVGRLPGSPSYYLPRNTRWRPYFRLVQQGDGMLVRVHDGWVAEVPNGPPAPYNSNWPRDINGRPIVRGRPSRFAL